MRKFICLATLAASLVLILSVEEASAGRHRRACYCPQPCCVVVVCPQFAETPQVVTAPPKTFVSPKGRTHLLTLTMERDDFEKNQATSTSITGASDPEGFRGTDRQAAKLSVADAPSETFPDVAELIATLPSDDDMLGMGISRDATSDRVTEEKRNVVVTGFLYAVKHENDNDFHLIVGTDPDAGAVTYLNVEVSGLPPGGPNRAKLRAPRTAFKTFFSDQTFGSNYTKINPPVAVRISGSLFFDVDHRAGVVGPQGLRPNTAWEIHPATDITFEP